MIINEYCTCGMYLGEFDTKERKVFLDKDVVFKDGDTTYRCKHCKREL